MFCVTSNFWRTVLAWRSAKEVEGSQYEAANGADTVRMLYKAQYMVRVTGNMVQSRNRQQFFNHFHIVRIGANGWDLVLFERKGSLWLASLAMQVFCRL